MIRVLVLGGTGEARRLAAALAGTPEVQVVSSLAGRVAEPARPVGEVRVGGFGGVAGLVGYLRAGRIDAVVDATHPFAATMSAHAMAATDATGVPLLVLRRPGWTERPGDRWLRVPTIGDAARTVAGLGSRVFLTTGRQGLAAFADLDAWFLVRTVDPPEPPLPRRLEVLLDRGPFTVDGERDLLRRHRIDVLVTKDSGGAMTAAKLAAARELGVPVVMVDRPAATGAPAVETIDEVLRWVAGKN
jgi:precorrin-6A/cobalt-precorrin-6A reductase